MIYPARSPWRASGDTVPSRVQLSSPGPESPKCRGANTFQVLIAVLAVPAIVVAVGLVWSQL
jgi:hypothetical protein